MRNYAKEQLHTCMYDGCERHIPLWYPFCVEHAKELGVYRMSLKDPNCPAWYAQLMRDLEAEKRARRRTSAATVGIVSGKVVPDETVQNTLAGQLRKQRLVMEAQLREAEKQPMTEEDKQMVVTMMQDMSREEALKLWQRIKDSRLEVQRGRVEETLDKMQWVKLKHSLHQERYRKGLKRWLELARRAVATGKFKLATEERKTGRVWILWYLEPSEREVFDEYSE